MLERVVMLMNLSTANGLSSPGSSCNSSNVMRGYRVVVLLAVSLLARVLLLWQGSQEWLGKRIEISTPINQWMRSNGSALLNCTVVYHVLICMCSEGGYCFDGEWSVPLFRRHIS